MIETFLAGRVTIMQPVQSRKEESHDLLCEEFLKERAAVLGRAGVAVEDALAELIKLDQEIQAKNEQLQALKLQEQRLADPKEQQVLIEDINAGIDQFNTVLEKAKLKYYYFIVTREALGLRRHDRIREMYVIPAKKKKVQAF
jgi:hypothetical protein